MGLVQLVNKRNFKFITIILVLLGVTSCTTMQYHMAECRKMCGPNRVKQLNNIDGICECVDK